MVVVAIALCTIDQPVVTVLCINFSASKRSTCLKKYALSGGYKLLERKLVAWKRTRVQEKTFLVHLQEHSQRPNEQWEMDFAKFFSCDFRLLMCMHLQEYLSLSAAHQLFAAWTIW